MARRGSLEAVIIRVAKQYYSNISLSRDLKRLFREEPLDDSTKKAIEQYFVQVIGDDYREADPRAMRRLARPRNFRHLCALIRGV